ncbi:MAG TPA: hypothetical protein ENK91_11220, partial [Bacteroidetes bacterium]|nr:hypothetical protein [Bacteroidota bacterium]
MNRLSSNWTIVLKIFIPVFWFMFFGALTLATFITNPVEVPQYTTSSFKTEMLIILITGTLFFLFTFVRLKRVDADDKYIYVSNYFKTYRYPVENIDKIVIYNHLILKVAHLYFTGNSSFGKKIFFIPFFVNLREFATK